jgi:hypothetical protein
MYLFFTFVIHHTQIRVFFKLSNAAYYTYNLSENLSCPQIFLPPRLFSWQNQGIDHRFFFPTKGGVGTSKFFGIFRNFRLTDFFVSQSCSVSFGATCSSPGDGRRSTIFLARLIVYAVLLNIIIDRRGAQR